MISIQSTMNWVSSWFYRKHKTYLEFITYLRCETHSIKDRHDYFYQHCHLFSTELHQLEHRDDLYFISDLLVME